MLAAVATERSALLRGSTTSLAVVAALIGLLGFVGNVVFREAIAVSGQGFQMLGDALTRAVPPLTGYAAPLVLASGGVVLLGLARLFPEHTLGYGFPRFLEMLHLQGARVKRRWMVVKTLGSAVSLGAGAAVGQIGRAHV